MRNRLFALLFDERAIAKLYACVWFVKLRESPAGKPPPWQKAFVQPFMLAYTAEKLVPIVLVVDDVDVEVVVGITMIGIVVVETVVMMTIGSDVVVEDVVGAVVVVGATVVDVVVLVVAATLVVVVDALGPTGPSEPHPSRAAIVSTPAVRRTTSLTMGFASLNGVILQKNRRTSASLCDAAGERLHVRLSAAAAWTAGIASGKNPVSCACAPATSSPSSSWWSGGS